MQKILKRSVISLVLLLLLISSTTVFADDSIVITNWMTDAVLIDNGDLNITEDIEFEFDGSYNGVFRTLSLKDVDSIEDISIKEVEHNNKYMQVSKAKKGDKDVFTVKKGKKNLEIKIFSPSKDQRKTFRISYKVEGVPIKYNDIAELNYNFIGRENDTEVKQFSAVLKLPFPFTENRVKIFGHGPLQGNVSFLGDDSIKVDVADIESGENVTLRTLFPTRFIKNSTNTRNEDAFERIMNEESAKIEKIEKKSKLKDSISIILVYVGGIVTALVVLLMIVFRRKKSDKSISDIRIERLMENSTPAEVSIISNSIIGENTIVATMLDLARKGYIEIEMDKDLDDSTVIIKKREADDRLTDGEAHFLNFFLNRVGNKSRVSTEEIKNYSEKYKSTFSEFMTKWTEKVNNKMEKEGYFNPQDKKIGSIIIVGFTVLLIISFILFFYVGEGRMIRGVFFTSISFIGLLYGIQVYSRKSLKGYREYKAWHEFKLEINEIKKDKEDKDLKDLLKYPLETTLIYSIAVGVKEEVIDKFRIKIKEDEKYNNYSINPWLMWYVFYGNSFNSSINQSLTNSGTFSGSGLGGGGSFSGGAGGAGGGGAGGF